jgi:methylated-DNA-[protein]-cysteine S-methyltransferase
MTNVDSIIRFTRVPSPIGPLLLAAEEGAPKGSLSALFTNAEAHVPNMSPSWREDTSAFSDASRQLTEYFAGRRRAFDLVLQSSVGTPFERAIWKALQTIGYGELVSYTEVGRRAERPGAVRAVGAAVGRNPWGIIVPCHRVVGASGKMTGFAGGLARKRFLLEHEGVRVTAGKGKDDREARAFMADPSALRLF